MLGLFKKKRPKPEVDESRIDLNIRKELEKTFIKRHVMNEKAVNAIVNIFRNYPQEIIIFDIIDMKSRKFNEIEVKKLSYIESINYPGSFLIIYNSEYQPLIYWHILSGNIYIHPQFNEIEIVEDAFNLTENYLWESFNSDVKDIIYFVDTKIRGYKSIGWSATWDSLEFFELVEAFNITGAILNEGYEETNEILEQYKVEYEKYEGFLLINGNIHPEFLMKYYNINGNQGTICEMALFVDMKEPISKEMIKGKYVDIKDYKVILPIDDYDDILCFFNF